MQNHLNFLTMVHESDKLQLEDGLESGIRHVYDGHIKGYSGMFTDGVVERIRELPEVDYVERDQIVHTTEVQKSAPWVGH
jgi:cerevisin